MYVCVIKLAFASDDCFKGGLIEIVIAVIVW